MKLSDKVIQEAFFKGGENIHRKKTPYTAYYYDKENHEVGEIEVYKDGLEVEIYRCEAAEDLLDVLRDYDDFELISEDEILKLSNSYPGG
jgi:hypothetical protein